MILETPKENIDNTSTLETKKTRGALLSNLTEETNILTKDETEKVKANINFFLDSVFQNIPPGDSSPGHELTNLVGSAVSSLYQSNISILEQLITNEEFSKKQEIVKLFYQEMINAIDHYSKSLSEDDLRKGILILRQFAITMQQIPLQFLELEEKIKLCSRVTGMGEKCKVLQTDFIQETVYSATFSELERIVDMTKGQSIPELLDLIRVLIIIKRGSHANSYSENTVHEIDNLIEQIRNKNSSQFINYACDIARYDISKMKDIFDSQIDQFGKDSFSKISIDYSAEDENINSLYNNNYFQKIVSNSNEKLSPENYSEMLKKPIFQINEEELEDVSLLMQEFHSPFFIDKINKDLDIDIRQIPLASQVHLLRFLMDKDKSTFDNLKTALISSKADKKNILESFLLCSENKDFGNALMELATKDGSEEIFDRFCKIIDVLEDKRKILKQFTTEEFDNHDIDSKNFAQPVYKRAFLLLKKAINIDPNKLQEILYETEEFETDVIAWGALFKASAMGDNGIKSPNELNDLFNNIGIKVFQCGDIVTIDENKNMIFKKQNLFNQDDYNMVVENLDLAYKNYDPEWFEVLKANIEKDLNDEKVQFVTVRNEDSELVGVIKVKPHETEENAWYVGTMYVDKEYQQGFGVGNYLQNVIKSLIPENARLIGSIGKNNPALERHVDINSGILTDIVFESNKEHSSKELFQLEWNYKGEYPSKNLSKEEIIQNSSEQGEILRVDQNNNDILAFRVNASNHNDLNFLNLSKSMFNKGYVISRLFFDEKEGLQLGYVVFEKNKMQSTTNSITENIPIAV